MNVESLEQESGNWRAARRHTEKVIFDQWIIDREAGRHWIVVRGERHRLCELDVWELRELARQEANDITIEAIHKSKEAA